MKLHKIIINSALTLILCAAVLVALPVSTPAPPSGPEQTTAEVTTPGDIPAVVLPQNDFNGNGKPDSIDILEGARADAQNMPTYDDSYWSGGYPPDDIGVCADVVWRAFKNAGYDLKAMIDTDIQKRTTAYIEIKKPDPNIDFRRVVNLLIFFQSYAVPLTNDINDTEEWQAGDIVIFCNEKDKPDHIGIISDRRAEDGTPFLIHNSGQEEREENALRSRIVLAHFRFDASLIEKDVLFAWEDQN